MFDNSLFSRFLKASYSRLHVFVLHLCPVPLPIVTMKSASPTPPPEEQEELDDPYIHSVSTEEFVETVERASHEEDEKELTPSQE